MSFNDRLAKTKAAIEAVLAKGEDNLTASDIEKLKGLNAEAHELQDSIETLDTVHKRFEGLTDNLTDTQKSGVAHQSLGDFVVKSIGEQLAKIKGVSGASIAAPEWAPRRKANTDTQVAGGPSGVYGSLLTYVDPNFVQAYRRPTITNLFGVGAMSGQAVIYYVEGEKEGDFDTVGEGEKFSQIHYADATEHTDALSTIAGFIKESNDMITDLAFLKSDIDGRLLYNLSLVEEKQLLNGDGTGKNINGLLNREGIQSYTATDAGNDVAVLHAQSMISTVTGMMPDALVINPTDYEAIRLKKDNDGNFIGGGPFYGVNGGALILTPRLWGLDTVVTPAVDAGTAIVGSFKGAATFYRKGGVTVEATNSNDTDFISDLVTIRAKERVALAVRKPKAFVKLTLK